MGRVSISEGALTQMVLHCVADFSPVLEVIKVIITEKANTYGIEVLLRVPYKTQLVGEIQKLQSDILENIERFTGLVLDEVNITIDRIS